MDSHTDSAQVRRLEVVQTGRRRRWSEDEKLRIVLESLQGPRQASATARLFAGSDRGGERAALMYTLIQTARLNDVDPQAWLADVLARGHSIRDLDRLLPWHWTRTPATLAA